MCARPAGPLFYPLSAFTRKFRPRRWCCSLAVLVMAVAVSVPFCSTLRDGLHRGLCNVDPDLLNQISDLWSRRGSIADQLTRSRKRVLPTGREPRALSFFLFRLLFPTNREESIVKLLTQRRRGERYEILRTERRTIWIGQKNPDRKVEISMKFVASGWGRILRSIEKMKTMKYEKWTVHDRGMLSRSNKEKKSVKFLPLVAFCTFVIVCFLKSSNRWACDAVVIHVIVFHRLYPVSLRFIPIMTSWSL